jgi:hypothetical protein
MLWAISIKEIHNMYIWAGRELQFHKTFYSKLPLAKLAQVIPNLSSLQDFIRETLVTPLLSQANGGMKNLPQHHLPRSARFLLINSFQSRLLWCWRLALAIGQHHSPAAGLGGGGRGDWAGETRLDSFGICLKFFKKFCCCLLFW